MSKSENKKDYNSSSVSSAADEKKREEERQKNRDAAADKDRNRLRSLEDRVDRLVQALRKSQNLDLEPASEEAEREAGYLS
jgi:hypothetical protein